MSVTRTFLTLDLILTSKCEPRKNDTSRQLSHQFHLSHDVLVTAQQKKDPIHEIKP